MGYTISMRVEETEVYREWINGLKDRAGGEKSTQQRDIKTAIHLAKNFQE